MRERALGGRFLPAAFLLVAALAAASATADAPVPTRPVSARPSEPTLVPDSLLRAWDPVTIFFPRPTGPESGGPEDRPERFVTLQPAHPGAFTWLDAKTLQFRPAEPWPPLARTTWKVGRRSFRLATLMAPPVETLPAAGAEGLPEVETITLFFAEPISPEALARVVRVELRPLPGIDGQGARWLGGENLEIKVLERLERSQPAGYVLRPPRPIGPGQRVVLHFRLSLEEGAADSFHRVAFQTAEPFRVLSFGCREGSYPVTPEGARYTPDQAIRCDPEGEALVVRFSAAPAALGPVEGRNLVRLSPAVAGLEYRVAGKELEVRGRFDRERRYRVTLHPTPIRDRRGRPLDLEAEAELYLHFPAREPFLRWGAGSGLLERFGPQQAPLAGRGEERVDVRLHRIDPLDRSFWPFPEGPVVVDESRRPPGPGEEEPAYEEPMGRIRPEALGRQITQLGSPPVSELVDLPLRREGGAATFGLDLEPHLRSLAGPGAPGTYLAGMRRLDGGGERSWVRLTVTDLALTTVEEPRRVVFAVTSLAGARPVPGARVRVEGSWDPPHGPPRWRTFFEGVSDAEGRLAWEPGPELEGRALIRRLVVAEGDDLLVLDAARPPDVYADNHLGESRGSWLQWTLEGDLPRRGPRPEELAHLFTERPVYRPEHSVHVKGYLRRREGGLLRPIHPAGLLVVEGPGALEWRYPVEVGEAGSFYHRFEEENLPTGQYRAYFLAGGEGGRRLGSVSFRKEAYRLPRFEVRLDGPDRVPLDHEFEIDLTATYYAGGRVADRPISWRATQFPYDWRPRARQGYLYSSDGRFSRGGRFESTPALEKESRTDEDGSATLLLDPALEPTAQARTYMVEATVTGADDQTVTAVRQVVALPPFLLGLKVPRYLERAEVIRPEVLVIGPDDEPLAGEEVTVRLKHRRWHSHLRASDFSDGTARYVTDVVDETVAEREVISREEPLHLELPIDRAGVYVVELEARDRLGRAQVVAVDLYAGGAGSVSWSKPATAVFAARTDKSRYRPGEEAAVVLESPFQRAEVLAIVEAPEGNRYEWLSVRGGQATYRVQIAGHHAPRLPVHFVLMRGRLEGTRPIPGSAADLGKPATLGATAWLEVEPVANRLLVELAYPERTLPGREIEVGVALADPEGRPLAGEVTLWLVDQAVLALGREQRLDPLPDFLTPVRSHLEIRDTRDLAFGHLPFAEAPGGGEGAREEKGLLGRQTVRRNFQPVPYFNPAVRVDESGTAVVRVRLPDDLTNFELRAKAVSGPDRFGFASGRLAVRLPVIVEPALPRFVRPGDRFVAGAVGRLVEGEAGPGRAEARFEGVELLGDSGLELDWVPDRAERLAFPVRVPAPAFDAEGRLEREEVVFRVGVERLSDGAGDAFEVRLPIRDDRRRETRRLLAELGPGEPLALPAPEEEVRPGSLRQSVFLASEPALARMTAGLDMLLAYPHGCTEQRISPARALLALGELRELLAIESGAEVLEHAVRETLDWLPQVVGDDGLVAYWPGSRGYVSLTAWVVEFLGEARAAGFAVDEELFTTLTRALGRALRSDYGAFIDGEAWAERAHALVALARVGRFEAAYAAELARAAEFLDLEGVASVLLAFVESGQATGRLEERLVEELWRGVVFRLHQGREVYGGLAERRRSRSALILPSETRTLATVTRALARSRGRDPRLGRLRDALVGLGRDDGWGSTNANAEAMLALAELLEPPFAGAPRERVAARLGGRERQVSLGPEAPTARLLSAEGGGELRWAGGEGEGRVAVRAELSYLPLADGAEAGPRAAGFVVERELVVDPDRAGKRLDLGRGGHRVDLSVGDVVEEHVRVVNPEDRNHVAVVVPLAAGMEPLNPALATAPPEARPSGSLTLEPSYAAFLDDRVAYYYDRLPKGSYDFYFRTRAAVEGSFVQPPALAEKMYELPVSGRSVGARLEIARGGE